jgi:hypothetical protein
MSASDREYYIIDQEMLERRKEIINYFYDNGMSMKLAKASARLWAQGFIDDENQDDVFAITELLDLDEMDAFAVLEKDAQYAEMYREKKAKNWFYEEY